MAASLGKEKNLINYREEKQLIGALFGYLFKFMIGGYGKTIAKRVIDPRISPMGCPPHHKNAFDFSGNEVYPVSASYFSKKGKQ